MNVISFIDVSHPLNAKRLGPRHEKASLTCNVAANQTSFDFLIRCFFEGLARYIVDTLINTYTYNLFVILVATSAQ